MTKIVKYQNKNGETRFKFRYYAGIDDKTGKKRYIKRSNFLNETDAKNALSKITYQVSTGEYFKRDSNIKFNELFTLWLELYKGTVKASTYATTKRILKQHVLPFFKDYFVRKITVVDCQRAVNCWFNEYPKQMKKYIFYTARILEYAIKLEIIESNPMDNVIKPKTKKNRLNSIIFTRKTN